MSTRFQQNIFSALVVAAVSLFSLPSQAGVVINGTRVIYPQNEKTVTVQLTNAGDQPVLAQSWIDNGDVNANPQTMKVPFILTPPINRIEPKKAQTLRLSYTGQPLPLDKESVFYLNVLEIPAKPKDAAGDNLLQMAFRSRIKLFFRPAGLAGNPTDAANGLRWSMEGGKLKATNPSAFNVSLVTVGIKGAAGKPAEGEMVAPGGSRTFTVAGATTGKTLAVEWINDYGAIVNMESVIH